MSTESTNPAEAMATKPIRWSSAAVAIALMTSLSLGSLINNVYDLEDEYVSIIASQQDQLLAAASRANPARETAGKPITDQTPKETNRIIVKYKEKDLPPGLAIAAERANLEKAQGLKELLTISGINAVVYEVAEDDTASEVVDRLLTSNKNVIEYVEVDMLVAPTLIPNDPLFANQWHHTNVQTPTAWDTALGEGVTIATLDTGVNPNHTDLIFSTEPGWNFYDNNSNWADIHGHGTKVAGTAAATGNNTIGVSGIAPKAKNLPVRIADATGYAYYSTISSGVTYSADHGARVANVSFAGACGSASIISAAGYMRSKGGVVVTSAGNTGADTGIVASGAVTCVSATASNDLRTSWSSYGASVDLTAPGAGIYTTDISGGYSAPSGTSFSSPLVAGIYALIFSANPALTPNQADSILFSTADDIGEPGWDMYYGYGRVNAAKAVAAALAAVGTRDAVAPSAPSNLKTATVSANAIALSWNAATDDNSGIAGYSIYRNGTKLATIAGTTYNNSGLSPLTAYSYTVKAEDVAGNSSTDSNTVAVTTPDIAFGISTFSVPTKTATVATVATTLTKPGTVVVKYGTTAANLVTQVPATTAALTHNLSLTNLIAATTYYYQVVATDASGTVVSSAVSSFKTNKATGGGKPRR